MAAKRLRTLWDGVGGMSKSVVHLTLGSTGGLLTTLVAAPVLTRLYSPSDLGVLAIFVSLVSLGSVLATAGYSGAVVLPKRDVQAVEVARLSILLSLCVSLLAACVIVLLPLLSGTVSRSDLAWLIWIAPAVFFAAANETLVSFASRTAKFRLIATTTFLRQSVQTATQIAVGFAVPSPAGLCGGTAVASVAANTRLLRHFRRTSLGTPITRAGLIQAAREYRNFPRHVLPAALLAALSSVGLNFVVAGLFGASVLGLWSLAQRLLMTPITLLGNSVARVFYARAAELNGPSGDLKRLYLGTLRRLVLVSAPPFIFIAAAAPWAFATAFGPEWADAGSYCQLMVPWIWARFLASPLGSIVLVLGKSRITALSQVALTAIYVVLGLSGAYWHWTATQFLATISGASAVFYVVLQLVYYRQVSGVAALQSEGER